MILLLVRIAGGCGKSKVEINAFSQEYIISTGGT